MSAILEDSTTHQPRARTALGAALAGGPSHAYLFRGPRGAGKRGAARAFAAEILAGGAGSEREAEEARRRALLDPSPHPDLVWLAPRGAQHLVEEVRERVIRAAVYRPYEGEKRVFVIEAAEAMRDESQNALLKTLEEPPGFAHVILLSSEPSALLETIASRCQPVDFAPLPVEAVETALAAGDSGGGDGKGAEDEADSPPGGEAGAPPAAPSPEIAAAARLSGGDVELARFLLTEQGRGVRADALRLAAAIGPAAGSDETAGGGDEPGVGGDEPAGGGDGAERGGEGSAEPWRGLLDAAEAAGEEAEAAAREALEAQKEAGVKRSARDVSDEAKRAGRRRRTEVLDLGLSLAAAWLRDLAATAAGAADLAHNRDRLDLLEAHAARLAQDHLEGGGGEEAPPAAADLAHNRARRAAELVQDTRRRLDLNVSEELALEALSHRLAHVLMGRAVP